MSVKIVPKPVETDEMETKEYSLVIDGVIETKMSADVKQFFDGLLDAIIDYVEKQNALAGLSMSYQDYKDPENDEEENDAERTQDR